MKKKKYVYWLEELNKNSVLIAGGKGANLGEMYNAGFPVPEAFVVSADAYYDYISKTGIKEKIRRILQSIDYNSIRDLNKKTKEIRDLIVNGEIPEEIKKTILDAYDKLCEKVGEKCLVIVRSSATAEDIKEASFAGQMETYFNVTKDKLLYFVKKCWASLFTARATFYRHKKGFDHLKTKIAVIVQKMIHSEVSGIAFTKHPVSGEDIIIIEAVYGIGEGAVSGRYTPDHYEVDPKNWKIIKKEISKQEKMLIYAKGHEGENVEVDVPKDKVDKQKLPDEKIIELAKICRKIEEHYKFPQDIEWAYEKGKIYIVQSRPITTIRKEEVKEMEIKEIKEKLKPLLRGLPASPGLVVGKVRIIKDLSDIDKLKEGEILVTTMTNPDMVPAMRKAKAIITDEGGITSHAAIVSRELGIPCIVGTKFATTLLKNGQLVTVDANRGIVYEGNIIELLRIISAEKYKVGEKVIEEEFKKRTKTKIYVNISDPDIAEKIAKKFVDGVGLLRAEFIVTRIGLHPKYAIEIGKREYFVNELAKNIARVAKAFYPRPVVYRSFDFKTNEYRELEGGEKYEPVEANPMIGYRGAIRAIKDKEIFDIELDALKKVIEEYKCDNIILMIPFVRTVNEIKELRKRVEKKGLFKHKNFKFWMMVEVPSNVFLIEKFLDYVDGISIGTNDLTQLILGADRDNPLLSDVFNVWAEPVLKAVEIVIKACKKKGKTSSICGQAPSIDEDFVRRLVEFGITSISVNPDAIVKARKIVYKHEKLLERLKRENN